MTFRPVKLPGIPGALLLTALPGSVDPLARFTKALEAHPNACIVSLTEVEEMRRWSPEFLAWVTAHRDWVHLPIADGSPPTDVQAFDREVQRAAKRLLAGQDVVVHCRAGIGRTGMFAAAVLACLGQRDAKARTRDAGSGAETPAQRDFLATYMATVKQLQIGVP